MNNIPLYIEEIWLPLKISLNMKKLSVWVLFTLSLYLEDVFREAIENDLNLLHNSYVYRM